MNFNNQEINNDFRNNTSNTLREEKIKMLLDYAKDCYREGHKPTKKEIRRKFHLEIYNYFRNIADYHEKAGIRISLRNYPKEQARQYILNYVRTQVAKENYPNRKELEFNLKIHISTYFKNLKEIYNSIGIDYGLVEDKNEKIIANARLGAYTLEQGKELISNYIKIEVRNNRYPTIRGIYRDLRIAFYHYFNSIFEAYHFASIKYPFNSSNFLAKEKEKILTEISEKLLKRMNYLIDRISIKTNHNKNRGSDFLVRDNVGDIICIEIKAFHKDQGIMPREILQLKDYMNLTNSKRGILITTSTIITKNLPKEIEIIDANKLIKLLNQYNLDYDIYSINWIMNERIGRSDEELKDKIRQKIINYFKSNNLKSTKKELEKIFCIDLTTYFGNKSISNLKSICLDNLGPISPR